MDFSCCKFIVHDDGTLIRLRNNIFDRLMRDPQHHNVVTPVDVLIGMRLINPDQLEQRRHGQVPYLERVISGGRQRLANERPHRR
jgi:hypothetical protein